MFDNLHQFPDYVAVAACGCAGEQIGFIYTSEFAIRVSSRSEGEKFDFSAQECFEFCDLYGQGCAAVGFVMSEQEAAFFRGLGAGLIAVENQAVVM